MKKLFLIACCFVLLSGCFNPRMKRIDEKDSSNINSVDVVLFEW